VTRFRFAVLAMTTAAASIGFVVAAPVAVANAPGPGDPCTVWHATTQDATGQTMWCNHMMTGTHGLVWQYGGPD